MREPIARLVARARAATEREFEERHSGQVPLVLELPESAGLPTVLDETWHAAKSETVRGEGAPAQRAARGPDSPFQADAQVIWVPRETVGLGPIEIGRDPQCHVVLYDRRASRHHATLSPDRASAWTVADNGTTNGTSLNGRRLPSARKVPISGGDCLAIADAVVLRPFFSLAAFFRALRRLGEGIPGAESDGTPAPSSTPPAKRPASKRSRRETKREKTRRPEKAAQTRARASRAPRDQAHGPKQLLSALQSFPGYGVLVANARGDVLVASEGVARLLRPEGAWPARVSVSATDERDHLPPSIDPLARAVRGQATDDVPLFVRGEEGSEGRWISASGRPIRARARTEGAVVLFHDVTDLKRLEEHSRQEQKMEAIGRLAGGIAHDFNNVLTAITGHTEMLLDVVVDERVRTGLEEMRKAGQRAASLTRQLLAFSRRSMLQPRVLDVGKILAELESMLHGLIGEDVELLVVRAGGLWHVRADPGQLEQVILNLAANARDAMPEGGKLTVEVQNVVIDESCSRSLGVAPGEYVLLAVTDDGIGMDQKTLSHIFEPYFTTKPTGEGTGLGLSMVYGMVKQSGGHVCVSSEPGSGSTFRLYFPRVDAEIEDATPPRTTWTALAPRGTETVMLVEDDAAVRSFVEAALRSQGYELLVASGGRDALALASGAKRVDLLLTDVVMPEMNGREVYERLARERRGLPVIYMSGHTESAIVHRGVLERGTNFLQKPFSPAALLGLVRAVLDRARARL